ncbi:hypothetical protein OIU84_000322 [Salix udensis]|uniref:Uncharacterized protein n=1 Tax=Salix udensis TaxID=889485 RepID=A0AAD6L4C6_9ROSI|nr:hypothetical protein OIU84_000322 [Salix udensis]
MPRVVLPPDLGTHCYYYIVSVRFNWIKNLPVSRSWKLILIIQFDSIRSKISQSPIRRPAI